MYLCIHNKKTMLKHLFPLLLFVPMCLFAQEQNEQSYSKGDTLYFDVNHHITSHKKAASYGVIKHVDEQENCATILVFTMKDNRLVEQLRCIASGEDIGIRKGKQLFFNQEGRVEEMKIYALVYNKRYGKTYSRPVKETLLYPDGKVREELDFTYPENQGVEEKCYVRKGFYPNGVLQFEETYSKESTFVYYDEEGQPTSEPAQTIEPYMVNPEFPGGQQELFYFLANSVVYPSECQYKGIQGRVICEFTVAKNGKIEDVHVVRSGGHPLLDREAVRVLRSMPKWKPGLQRGVPIRVQYTVPVNFRLE